MNLHLICFALVCTVLAACSGTENQGIFVPSGSHGPVPDFKPQPLSSSSIRHITVVIMENHDYSQVMGSKSAPYLTAFALANAYFTNSHALGHPSEPNYLALFSGSPQGVSSDACPLTLPGDNLASELAAHGYSFQGYAEDWPSSGNPCYAVAGSTSSGYFYWRKHVPWTDFSNVSYRTYGHSYGGPGTALAGSVNFIAPNICDDMHDCSTSTGDAWLAKNIPPIERYDDANAGLLIVTFDESDYSTSNQILTVMSGPMVKPGAYSEWIDHYSVLRLIESNFGLPLLGSSATAPVITGVISGAASYSFDRSGTVESTSATHVVVQFGSGCGWLRVYETSATVYSPSSWQPKAGNSVTVYGSGSCSTSATASMIVEN